MPHDAHTVANAFIQLGLDNSRPITPMAAMKMTFLAHAWHLGHTGQPLIHQEVVDWVYGPVIWDITEKLPETKFWKNVKVFLPQVKPGILPDRLIAQVHRRKLQNARLLASRP